MRSTKKCKTHLVATSPLLKRTKDPGEETGRCFDAGDETSRLLHPDASETVTKGGARSCEDDRRGLAALYDNPGELNSNRFGGKTFARQIQAGSGSNLGNVSPRSQRLDSLATSQGAVSQGAVSQGAVSQGAGSQGAVSQGAGSQGAGSQCAVSQGTVSQGTVSQGAGSQGTVSQGAGSRSAVSQVPSSSLACRIDSSKVSQTSDTQILAEQSAVLCSKLRKDKRNKDKSSKDSKKKAKKSELLKCAKQSHIPMPGMNRFPAKPNSQHKEVASNNNSPITAKKVDEKKTEADSSPSKVVATTSAGLDSSKSNKTTPYHKVDVSPRLQKRSPKPTRVKKSPVVIQNNTQLNPADDDNKEIEDFRRASVVDLKSVFAEKADHTPSSKVVSKHKAKQEKLDEVGVIHILHAHDMQMFFCDVIILEYSYS